MYKNLLWQGCQFHSQGKMGMIFTKKTTIYIMKPARRKTTIFTKPQTHQFDFYKDNTGWYIDFPEFISSGMGCKADLAMVAGADDMLDHLSKGAARINLIFSNAEIKGYDFRLKMIHHNQWGATYSTNVEEIESAWLCNVTKVVFGGFHPREIFVRVG